MKARTRINKWCTVFFCYEDWCGNFRFGNYHEAAKLLGEGNVCLTGWLHSSYYGTAERIHTLEHLQQQPSMKEVKKFIAECYSIIKPTKKKL